MIYKASFPACNSGAITLIVLLLGALTLLIRPTLADAQPVTSQVTEVFINESSAEVWRVFTTAEGRPVFIDEEDFDPTGAPLPAADGPAAEPGRSAVTRAAARA